ncbi:MAG: formylmethanofuran--tetrahydromethanopterin N-formyltransferase [Candidatus Bathyarchaeota archaeon]|nr:formylmethanofuran--tetrahydromethanopterin N-formyltransferase [Candidatus Bathyarchaeota archaeon]
MSTRESESKATESENGLEVVDREENGDYIVKHQQTGNTLTIVNTFAEMFPMWLGRILITAETRGWALTAARAATGFAASVIMSPAEAGIEKEVLPEETVDGRPGVLIQIYHLRGHNLKTQMITRIGQCVMTCPTTSAFNALESPVKRLKVGRSLSLFGDGFQRRDIFENRTIWRIPVMDGEFVIEDRFGVKRGVAGGNLLILAKDAGSGLRAADAAIKAAEQVDGVIFPFPGGICRSGSKVGSLKYKLTASTNHPFCPTLRERISDSELSSNVNSVHEIVANGLTLEAVKSAMAEGIKAASSMKGVVKITAANYGGKLGPYKAVLKEILNLS